MGEHTKVRAKGEKQNTYRWSEPAARPGKGKDAKDADAIYKAKVEKRQRQKAARAQGENEAIVQNKIGRDYNRYLRLAHASCARIPGDYYESNQGVWAVPLPGEHFDEHHLYVDAPVSVWR